MRKDPVSQQEKIVLIGISSGFNYIPGSLLTSTTPNPRTNKHNQGLNTKRFMIFYSVSSYHKWISDIITGESGNAVRIAVERNTGSPNLQIKPLFLSFSTLFVMNFWMH